MAREVNIKVNSQTEGAQKGTNALGASFKKLGISARGIGLGLAGIGAAGVLMGRSFVSTAISAGFASEAFWKWEDATFVLKRSIGELIINALSPLIEFLSGLIERFNNLNPALQKMIIVFGIAGVVIASIAGPLLVILALIPSIFAGVVLLTGGFASLSVAMGPVTLAILGIGAAIAAGIFIWKNWDTIMGGIKNNLNGFLPILSVVTGLMSFLGTILKDTGKGFSTAAAILGFLANAIPGVKQLLGVAAAWELLNLAWDKSAPIILDMRNELIELTKKAFKVAVAVVVTGGSGTGEGGTGQQLGIGQGLNQLLNSVFPKDTIAKRLEEGSAVLNEAGNMYIAMPQKVSDQSLPLWRRIWERIKETWTGFTSWFQETAWPAFQEFWDTSWEIVKGIVSTIWASIKNKITEIWDALSTWFQETAWPAFSGFWESSWDSAKDFLSEIWESMKTVAISKWDDITDAIKGKLNGIIGMINDLIERWNSLEFRVPRIDLPFGGSLGGFTVGTPNIQPIKGFADGVKNFSGGLAIVGERGPELVNLPRGSSVTPNGAGATLIYQQNAPVYGFLDFEKQVAAAWMKVKLSGGFRGAI